MWCYRHHLSPYHSSLSHLPKNPSLIPVNLTIKEKMYTIDKAIDKALISKADQECELLIKESLLTARDRLSLNVQGSSIDSKLFPIW